MKIKLKEARLAHKPKMSQRQLAIKSGVARSYISEIEAGKYEPTVVIMCKLSIALECALDDLIDCD